MDEIILDRGGDGPKFVIDFIIYVIPTYIIRNLNWNFHFRLLKYLQNMDEIQNYNWCAYLIKFMNDIVIEWKVDKSKFVYRATIFLMASVSNHIFLHLH